MFKKLRLNANFSHKMTKSNLALRRHVCLHFYSRAWLVGMKRDARASYQTSLARNTGTTHLKHRQLTSFFNEAKEKRNKGLSAFRCKNWRKDLLKFTLLKNLWRQKNFMTSLLFSVRNSVSSEIHNFYYYIIHLTMFFARKLLLEQTLSVRE